MIYKNDVQLRSIQFCLFNFPKLFLMFREGTLDFFKTKKRKIDEARRKRFLGYDEKKFPQKCSYFF